jgi:hypothetical protein
MGESDPIIRRLQTGALIWCGVATAISLAGWPRRPDIAAGIVCGGVLTAVSFFAIKSSIDGVLALVAHPTGDALGRRRAAARSLARMVGRYGLLAVLAYVMIARLRLHPVGLVVGASSLVASAALEAARWAVRPPHAGRQN